MKFIKLKIKNLFFIRCAMKFLKFHEFLDRGGMLCPWGQNGLFWGRLRLNTDSVRLRQYNPGDDFNIV